MRGQMYWLNLYNYFIFVSLWKKSSYLFAFAGVCVSACSYLSGWTCEHLHIGAYTCLRAYFTRLTLITMNSNTSKTTTTIEKKKIDLSPFPQADFQIIFPSTLQSMCSLTTIHTLLLLQPVRCQREFIRVLFQSSPRLRAHLSLAPTLVPVVKQVHVPGTTLH